MVAYTGSVTSEELPPVFSDLDGALARITLNRPDRLNAMSMAWVAALGRAVDRVAADTYSQVVLVRGAGQAFCAGLDLDMLERDGMPPGYYEEQERAFHRLETMEKIVVAAIHGYCLGGGVQLAIACDVRVCSTDAQLGLPAVNEGLFPGMAPFRLPRLVGLGAASRLVLSGEVLSAQEAHRLGLVDYVVPAESFDSHLNEILGAYLSAPRTASISAKRLLSRSFSGTFDAVFQESLPLLKACLASPEVAAARETWRRRKRVPRK